MAPLLNPLATADQNARTPSREDGIPADLEDDLRMYGCQLIQQAGILLELPQKTMATAQVLFQRFWFVTSMRALSIRDVGLGALFLSTKLEETPIRLRDLINVFDFLIKRALHSSAGSPCPRVAEHQQRRHGKQAEKSADHAQAFAYEGQDYFSDEFYDTKDAMVIAEMQLLKRLGFNVQVNLPYATMINYLQLLGLTDTARHPGVAQRAWSFLNDALQTTLYCLFPPHTLACAAVYLTALTSEPPIALPLAPAPWFELFDVTEAELRCISARILYLYDGKHGMASRVRDEWGGLAYFAADKYKIRAWIDDQRDSSNLAH